MSFQSDEVRKALFTSPGISDEKFDINTKSVNSKFQIQLETDVAVKNFQKGRYYVHVLGLEPKGGVASTKSMLVQGGQTTFDILTEDENHEKRMKKLRNRAKYLHEDAWMYPALDQLIGLK